MANLPDGVTCFESVYSRSTGSTSIAGSATTASPHIFTTGDIESDGDGYIGGDLAVAGSLDLSKRYTLPVTSVATAGVYTVTSSDCVLAVDTSGLSAAVTVHIPAAIAAAGQVLYVVDAGGAAGITGINIEIASGSIAPTTIATTSLGVMYVTDETNYYGFKSLA